MGSESGQSTVELALCLPLVAFLAGMLVQIGVIGIDQTRLWHAAREAARVAVVRTDTGAAEEAVRAAGFTSVDVSVDPSGTGRRMGEPLTVSLAYRPSGGVPLISRIFQGMTLRASATMRIEQP